MVMTMVVVLFGANGIHRGFGQKISTVDCNGVFKTRKGVLSPQISEEGVVSPCILRFEYHDSLNTKSTAYQGNKRQRMVRLSNIICGPIPVKSRHRLERAGSSTTILPPLKVSAL